MDTFKDDTTSPPSMGEVNIKSADEPEMKNFFPSGAITFFIFLVILSLAFWYGIYFLMIERI